ncbi:iron chelate uptake ABC transporter family permease subunit [Peribacillus sp. NPDC096622]|uniref:iron chelate uptake ABC transporter family permease subunit n=1 Tax=Peribacillus sp. NPDC096622 TaxID=3364396 RepID=UPI003815CB12
MIGIHHAFHCFSGFIPCRLIYALSWKKGQVTPARLLLVGIGINAAFGAGLVIFQMKMEPNNFMMALIWLSGTIWGTNREKHFI